MSGRISSAQKLAILESIRTGNGGILRPQQVVEAAAAADHPLHGMFEWNDQKAGAAYRIHQAEQLIRAVVVMLPNATTPIRAYCSLTTERDGGGYRAVAEVLSDDDARAQLIEDARREALAYLQKFRVLAEVAGIGEVLGTIESLLVPVETAVPSAVE